jgi:hypothetical protein
MTSSPRRHPARHDRRVSLSAQRGSTTAEFAVGVIAAVLVAALLLHLVLYGFFEDLLRSLFERTLDLAVDLVGSTMSWSLVDLVQGSWSGWSAVAGNSAGWIWDVAGHYGGAIASDALSISRAVAARAGSVAGAVVDATAAALRWVGGPVSAAVPR